MQTGRGGGSEPQPRVRDLSRGGTGDAAQRSRQAVGHGANATGAACTGPSVLVLGGFAAASVWEELHCIRGVLLGGNPSPAMTWISVERNCNFRSRWLFRSVQP